MAEQTVLRALRRLYRIADAGEKGYATAAANMDVPALKILFKLYANQRLSYKDEILDELRRLGDSSRPGASILGAIHRGRVAIFAGMSEKDGQEWIVLRETALGEGVAERAYQRALEQDLPEETRRLVERQSAGVREAAEKIRCLRDDVARRQAVRLAESDHEIEQAMNTLASSGFRPNEIETMELNDQVLYSGRGATQAETILAGIVGGMIWGGVMGILAGFGVLINGTVLLGSPFLTWLLTALGFVLVGAFISAVLALFISVGIQGVDAYQYTQIRQNANFLVQPKTCGTD